MKNKIKTDLIIIYINKNNLTKKEFLRRTGISVYAYNSLMRNDGNFKITTLFSVANEMGLSIKDFFD